MNANCPRRGLFLGSGFSYDFGMPLVSGLTKQLLNYLTPTRLQKLNKSWSLQGGGYGHDAMEKLINSLQTNSINYENIVGALEVQMQRSANTALYQSLGGLRDLLLELVYLLLCHRHLQTSTYLKTAVQLHRGFKSLIHDSGPTWVFTLNHDLIVEMLAAEYSIPIKNGSDENDLVELFLGPEPFDGEMLRFSRLQMDKELPDNYPWKYFHNHSEERTGINLLKLHGGLELFGYDDLNSYLSLLPVGPGVDGYLEALRILNERERFPPPRVTNHVLAYDSVGQLQILRRSILSGVYKFTKRVGQVVSNKVLPLFQGSLNTCTELIVIGYGFRDLHIDIIIRDWLEFAEGRKIVIVDPHLKIIPSAIAHLPSQIEIVSMSALDYFATLPGGTLSVQEKLGLDMHRQFRDLPQGTTDKALIKAILDKLSKIIASVK